MKHDNRLGAVKLMIPREPVKQAYISEPPDRIPRLDGFWDYPDEWRERLGEAEELSNIKIWVPYEGAFPSRERIVKEDFGMTHFSSDGIRKHCPGNRGRLPGTVCC